MKRELLEEYDKVLERLENVDWATLEMSFHLLEIHDKETLNKLANLSDDKLKEMLELTSHEIVKKMVEQNDR